MNNMSVNLFATNTKEIKTDKTNVKASESTRHDDSESFDSKLSKVKTKEIKTGKSVVKENTKNIAVSKSVDIKSVDEMQNKEDTNNMILTLINNVLQIPVEDIKQILEEMNIEPTDLLTQENFKAFLAYAYPDENEQQLLFNEDKMKDISKLFTKLEEIRTFEGTGQSNLIVEKLMTEDAVIKTTTTQVNPNLEKTAQELNGLAEAQVAAPVLQNKPMIIEQEAKNNLIEEIIPEGDLSEEGLLNFKQMGMGMNMPIQAFNSTMNTALWDTQITKTQGSQFLQDPSLTTQIVNKIDISSLGTHKEITMELSPKELGNLSIKLVENNGVLVAHIRVENEKTKELLLTEIKQLENTLEKQGLTIGEVKVDVKQNPHQSQMEQQRQKSTRRIQELIDKHLIDAQEDTMQVNEETGELIETEVNYMV